MNDMSRGASCSRSICHDGGSFKRSTVYCVASIFFYKRIHKTHIVISDCIVHIIHISKQSFRCGYAVAMWCFFVFRKLTGSKFNTQNGLSSHQSIYVFIYIYICCGLPGILSAFILSYTDGYHTILIRMMMMLMPRTN